MKPASSKQSSTVPNKDKSKDRDKSKDNDNYMGSSYVCGKNFPHTQKSLFWTVLIMQAPPCWFLLYLVSRRWWNSFWKYFVLVSQNCLCVEKNFHTLKSHYFRLFFDNTAKPTPHLSTNFLSRTRNALLPYPLFVVVCRQIDICRTNFTHRPPVKYSFRIWDSKKDT